MGLFSKQPKRTNETDNFALKEALAQEAIDLLLVQGRDYQNREELRAEFGYLFIVDEHGFEGLLRIFSRTSTFYFAVQENKIKALDFNDELFRITTQTFLNLYG